MDHYESDSRRLTPSETRRSEESIFKDLRETVAYGNNLESRKVFRGQAVKPRDSLRRMRATNR
ncbi:MAG: hypothetical protein ACI8TQ_000489 [Planctomycetota bacterium]|jgi:hypothetical protein